MLYIFSDATFYNKKRVNLGVFLILDEINEDVAELVTKKEYDRQLNFVPISGEKDGEIETLINALLTTKFKIVNSLIPFQPIRLYTDDASVVCMIQKNRPKTYFDNILLSLVYELNVDVIWLKGHMKKNLRNTEQKIFCYVDRCTRKYSKLLAKGHIFIPGISDQTF